MIAHNHGSLFDLHRSRFYDIRVAMSNVTPSREEIRAKIEAATGEVYADIAKLSGKLDVVGVRIDSTSTDINRLRQEMKVSFQTMLITYGLTILTLVGIAAIIVGVKW